MTVTVAGLHRTLGLLAHGNHDPTVRFEADGVWRASRTPDGPGTIRIGVDGCDVWGPGGGWLAARAAALMGLTDDDSTFDPSLHPVVERAHRTLGGFRFPATGRVVEAALPVILAQKITTGQAIRSWHGLVRLLGEPAPGPLPSLLLPPDPQRVAVLPYYVFHSLDVERRRAETIRAVARHARRLEEDPDRLRHIRGVGPWTIAKIRMVALGDADAVEVGDYHIPDHVTWALAGEPRGDDARMLELLAPWPGHRGRVIRLIALGAPSPPKYGPRLVPRSIVWH